jgi:hypothetical protein
VLVPPKRTRAAHRRGSAFPPAQLEAVRKLQRVWDEVHAMGRDREAAGGSGLTLVDAVDSLSSLSLWNLIASKLEAPARSWPPIRGLYLYGERPRARARSNSLAWVRMRAEACLRRWRGQRQDDADGPFL